MSMHVVYGHKGSVSIIIVVALICMDMHHCVVSLQKTCLLDQNGGLVAYRKFRKGSELRKGVSWVQKGPPIFERTKF